MKKRINVVVILAALSLCACGKEPGELDMSAKAEYIQRVKPEETASDGKVILKGSDDGVNDHGIGSVTVTALPKDVFLETMPEGAEYYEDLIRNRLTIANTENGLALIHFDSDALPELLVIDGNYHYGDGKLYSIGQDGRPYLMLKFIPTSGSVSYRPYSCIYKEEFGGQGWFMSLFLKYDGGNVSVLEAVNYDGNDISDSDDGTLAPIKYYRNVHVSESLKIVLADPMNVIGVADRIESGYDFETEKAMEIDASAYYELIRSYDGDGMVNVSLQR